MSLFSESRSCTAYSLTNCKLHIPFLGIFGSVAYHLIKTNTVVFDCCFDVNTVARKMQDFS